MKKKFLCVCSLIFCMMFVLVGCGEVEIVQFSSTKDTPYDFYNSNMISTVELVQGNCTSATMHSLQTTDSARVASALTPLTPSQDEEVAIMACIECFNETSDDDAYYYEYDDSIVRVEYVNSEKAYHVQMGSDEYSYGVSKNAEGAYQVSDKTSAGIISSAVVVFNKNYSSLSISMTAKGLNNETVKVYKEVITLKESGTIFRAVIEQGSTNNRNFYTIECFKEIFTLKAKVMKSSSNIGGIDTESFVKANFTKPSAVDVTGYEISVDSTQEKAEAKVYGDLTQWVMQ